MFSFKDITLGQYVDTRSRIHRLDPRTKLIVILTLMTAVLAVNNFYFLIVMTVGCFVLILLAKLPVTLVLKNLRPFLWLFGITFSLHLFFTGGSSLRPFPLYGINITHEGLAGGAFFTCRIAVLIGAAALFTLTTSPTELTDGCERMLNPLRRFKFPAHEMAMIMTISLRFIPTLVEEADRLRKAQRVRGIHFLGGPIKRAKSLVPLFVPLILSAFRRADELAAAMDARCYRGGKGRTHFRELKLSRRDYFALATTGIACLSCFLLR